MRIDIIELLRIKKIVGNIKYKNWSYVVKNRGEFCTMQVEYPIAEGAFTMGKKKSGSLVHSKCFYIQGGATEEEIMFQVIHAIEETEKTIMINSLQYKGKPLAEFFMTVGSLKKFTGNDDVPVK